MKRIATPTVTKELMREFSVSAKKSLGQNFIIEPQIIERIAAAADCDKQDLVLEIGPGLGSLTQALSEKAGQVVAVEIDKTLLEPLQSSFAEIANIEVVNADALEVDFTELLAPYQASGEFRPGFMAVANLPYYITTPIIMRFLETDCGWRRLVFMVQKELAARMQAKPGSKDYGALSLAVQYRARAKVAFTVPASVFIPRPKVDSAVIVLERLEQPPIEVQDENLLFAAIRAGFNQRRKTLLNSLQNGQAGQGGIDMDKQQIAAALAMAEIAPSRRAETLTIEEFGRLADALYSCQNAQ
jgi:16S rRNA (adenine1518-N6/adenine1519-N6)-dimethyltransferase